MKILITGFDPFGGASVNPAYEAVKLLPDKIKGVEIIKLEIPTVFEKEGKVLEAGIEEHKPDIVICVGQAGGRSGMSVEKIAINLMEARIPDNDGQQPFDEPIHRDGETGYFASIPVKAMVQKMREHGIPAKVSYTAGTFVCNDVMYRLLYLIDKKYPNIRGGFIHVPYLPEQVTDLPDGTPSMSAEMIAQALEYGVEAALENKQDISAAMGETH
ncbi:pyroglutamyl-peptidase I [Clostridium sp. C105KSO13]|uniref:pyroglutamyl-peptidase I n=1 Tax=Clostridium sp. C105KSO13 TaxID=1776045 RepID=UPI000740840B|nr:pyroglutamyl-peptidase I [Clostridium sp. C105KSO13]CUX29409.1 Pyrrolidone-carboxylate peptidase [Clostridium sp. C105KSO13]